MKTLPCFLLATLSATTAVAEDNWPQWRGAAGTGKTNAVAAVTRWGPDTNIRWRTTLPEAGNSTPSVWGGKIFLTQPLSDVNQRAVMCFHRQSGKELWRRGVTYNENEPTHRTNPYCSASPAVDDSLVIAWFGSAGLVCWDHNGKEIWRRDLGKQVHQWGYGSSPILYEDLCILNFGPGNREFLIAVEKATGKTVWKVEAWEDAEERKLSGPENDGGANDFKRSDQRAQRLRGSWSTPVITTIDGKTQLLSHAAATNRVFRSGHGRTVVGLRRRSAARLRIADGIGRHRCRAGRIPRCFAGRTRCGRGKRHGITTFMARTKGQRLVGYRHYRRRCAVRRRHGWCAELPRD